VEGPGKWSAPGPVLALGGPGRPIPNSHNIDSVYMVESLCLHR